MELTNIKGKKKDRKAPPVNLTNVYGKVPPHNTEAEKALLGGILIDPGAFDLAKELLSVECFYSSHHQTIFLAMENLTAISRPVTRITVIEELEKMLKLEEIGGAYYVVSLENNVVSATHNEHYARIIKEKFISRSMIQIGGELIQSGYDITEDPFTSLDQAENKIYSIAAGLNTVTYTKVSGGLVPVIQEIDNLMNAPEGVLSGVPSGYYEMDKLTHGWQNASLIILAARPAVGKTAFALNLARNAAKAGFPVGFFSLEMSMRELIQRLLSSESEVPFDKIRRGRLERDEHKKMYEKGIQPLASLELYIDDTPSLSVFDLKSRARRMVKKHGIKMFIVDYLQLMNAGEKQGMREQEISTISRNLKALAKTLKVPIIALSQLSRETEKRADKKPQLSDLRESGAIEQDADAVVFIYRPDYYELTHDAAGKSTKNITEFKFAKHRGGILDTIKLTANLSIQRFENFNVDLPMGGNWKPVEGGNLFDGLDTKNVGNFLE